MIKSYNHRIVRSPKIHDILFSLSIPGGHVRINSTKSTKALYIACPFSFSDLELEYCYTPEYWQPLYHALERIGYSHLRNSHVGYVSINKLMQESEPDVDIDISMEILYSLDSYDYSIGSFPSDEARCYYYLSRDFDGTEQVDLIIFRQVPFIMWEGRFQMTTEDTHEKLMTYLDSVMQRILL